MHAQIANGNTAAHPHQNPTTPRRRLATVRQAAAEYVGIFTEAAIRDLIFKADDRRNSRGDFIRGNGLAEAGAIVRIGRKVLIDLDAFEGWIDSKVSR